MDSTMLKDMVIRFKKKQHKTRRTVHIAVDKAMISMFEYMVDKVNQLLVKHQQNPILLSGSQGIEDVRQFVSTQLKEAIDYDNDIYTDGEDSDIEDYENTVNGHSNSVVTSGSSVNHPQQSKGPLLNGCQQTTQKSAVNNVVAQPSSLTNGHLPYQTSGLINDDNEEELYGDLEEFNDAGDDFIHGLPGVIHIKQEDSPCSCEDCHIGIQRSPLTKETASSSCVTQLIALANGQQQPQNITSIPINQPQPTTTSQLTTNGHLESNTNDTNNQVNENNNTSLVSKVSGTSHQRKRDAHGRFSKNPNPTPKASGKRRGRGRPSTSMHQISTSQQSEQSNVPTVSELTSSQVSESTEANLTSEQINQQMNPEQSINATTSAQTLTCETNQNSLNKPSTTLTKPTPQPMSPSTYLELKRLESNLNNTLTLPISVSETSAMSGNDEHTPRRSSRRRLQTESGSKDDHQQQQPQQPTSPTPSASSIGDSQAAGAKKRKLSIPHRAFSRDSENGYPTSDNQWTNGFNEEYDNNRVQDEEEEVEQNGNGEVYNELDLPFAVYEDKFGRQRKEIIYFDNTPRSAQQQRSMEAVAAAAVAASQGAMARRLRRASAELTNQTTLMSGHYSNLLDQWNAHSSHRVKMLSIRCSNYHCTAQFPNETQMLQHLQKEHQTMPHRCLVINCGQAFSDRTLFGKHILIGHQGLRHIACSRKNCIDKTNFANVAELHNHHWQKHELGLFQCASPNCKFTGINRFVVETHFVETHQLNRPQQQSSQNQQRQLQRLSQQSQSSRQSQQQQQPYSHPHQAYIKTRISPQKQQTPVPTNKTVTIRPVANHTRTTLAQLQRSFNSRPFRDDDIQFTRKGWECPFPGCGKTFILKNDTKRHVRIHRSGKPYRCLWPGCKQEATQKCNMIMHIRRNHLGVPATNKELREKGVATEATQDVNQFIEVRQEFL